MEAVVGKWTQEQAVQYECACECISDLIAIKQFDIYEEQSRNFPNDERISNLRNEVSALWCERKRLNVQDTTEIARIRTEYGAQILAFRASPYASYLSSDDTGRFQTQRTSRSG